MNEIREELCAFARRVTKIVPHIYYGTGPGRFGMVYMDCSGFCHTVYRHVGIEIGLDTGDIARQVGRGLASFVGLGGLRAGDLVMRRSGSTYNGGSDEHVGIFLYYETTGSYAGWMVTAESAGSKNGVGIYYRPPGFWRDGVRYPGLDKGGFIEIIEENPMGVAAIIEDQRDGAWYFYTGDTCAHLIPEEVAFHENLLGRAKLPTAHMKNAALIVDRARDRGTIRGGPKDPYRAGRKNEPEFMKNLIKLALAEAGVD